MPKARIALLTALAIFLIGCAEKRVAALSERAQSFNRSLRWSSLAAAGPLIAEENRREILSQISKDLHGKQIQGTRNRWSLVGAVEVKDRRVAGAEKAAILG